MKRRVGILQKTVCDTDGMDLSKTCCFMHFLLVSKERFTFPQEYAVMPLCQAALAETVWAQSHFHPAACATHGVVVERSRLQL